MYKHHVRRKNKNKVHSYPRETAQQGELWSLGATPSQTGTPDQKVLGGKGAFTAPCSRGLPDCICAASSTLCTHCPSYQREVSPQRCHPDDLGHVRQPAQFKHKAAEFLPAIPSFSADYQMKLCMMLFWKVKVLSQGHYLTVLKPQGSHGSCFKE